MDDSLDEAFELRGELELNASLPASERKTWILKPSMSDRGEGIRLFQTIAGLQKIFDEFEEDNDDGSIEDEGEGNGITSISEALAAQSIDHDNINNSNKHDENNKKVITSQLRYFIVQDYITNNLLLPEYDYRKFHIRTYIVCVGALKVYVYKNMLSLFALTPYTPPNIQIKQSEEEKQEEREITGESDSEDSEEEGESISMLGHLTNTCLQGERKDNKSVNLFWKLEGLNTETKTKIYNEICDITGELFKSAVNVGSINFQPLPNAFEIYGVDFLVTDDFHVKLLEVNAYPDFKQTGDDLVSVITTLCSAVVETAVKPYFEKNEKVNSREDMTLVFDKKLSGGW